MGDFIFFYFKNVILHPQERQCYKWSIAFISFRTSTLNQSRHSTVEQHDIRHSNGPAAWLNQPVDLGIRNKVGALTNVTFFNLKAFATLYTSWGRYYCWKNTSLPREFPQILGAAILFLFRLIGQWNFWTECDRRYLGISVKSRREIGCTVFRTCKSTLGNQYLLFIALC